jgi:hypothetical protein
VIAIVLGVIGVGGLAFQFGSGFIDAYQKDIDDLKAQVAALEAASGTSSSSSTSTDPAVTAALATLTTNVAALTTKQTDTCNKVIIFHNFSLKRPLHSVFFGRYLSGLG